MEKGISKIHYTKKSGVVTITFDADSDGTQYILKMPFDEAVKSGIVDNLYIKTKTEKSCQKTQKTK